MCGYRCCLLLIQDRKYGTLSEKQTHYLDVASIVTFLCQLTNAEFRFKLRSYCFGIHNPERPKKRQEFCLMQEGEFLNCGVFFSQRSTKLLNFIYSI